MVKKLRQNSDILRTKIAFFIIFKGLKMAFIEANKQTFLAGESPTLKSNCLLPFSFTEKKDN